MKKQIKLNENSLRRIIESTVKNILKEDSTFIGFDDNSIENVNREGGIEEVCRGKFNTVDELKEFLLDLGEVTASEDMMEEFIERIDSVIEDEGKTYN